MNAIELEVEELAEFLFVKNVNNAVIDLELNGIEDVRDLYCFCVDLLCKGLVIVCSKDGSKQIDLDSISMDEFSLVTKKIGMAGIKVIMKFAPNDGTIPSHVSLGEFYAKEPTTLDRLEEFNFSIATPHNVFSISFLLANVHI